MNYERIYSKFIADRLTKQPVKPAYFEKHHIIPRSLGGSDSKDNLIKLSARDHYFAHCCLAKIYGGPMWSALFAIAAMTKTAGSASYFLRGRMVAIARVRAAGVRGQNMKALWASGEFKRNRIYTPHPDETKEKIRTANIGRKNSSASIEKQKNTVRGKAKEFYFFCVETKEQFHGTQFEFSSRTGIGQSLASCLTRGRIQSAKGWMLRGGNVLALRGRDPEARIFENKDGRTFKGTTYEFRTEFGLDAGVISNLINGKNRVQSFKGWRHITQKAA